VIPDDDDEEARAVERVRRTAARMEKRRRERSGFWRHLGHVGVLGWIFVLPLVAAMGLGHWIGRRTGSLVPPLVGAGVGLFAGGWGVWRAITRDLEGEDEERAVKEEETP